MSVIRHRCFWVTIFVVAVALCSCADDRDYRVVVPEVSGDPMAGIDPDRIRGCGHMELMVSGAVIAKGSLDFSTVRVYSHSSNTDDTCEETNIRVFPNGHYRGSIIVAFSTVGRGYAEFVPAKLVFAAPGCRAAEVKMAWEWKDRTVELVCGSELLSNSSLQLPCAPPAGSNSK